MDGGSPSESGGAPARGVAMTKPTVCMAPCCSHAPSEKTRVGRSRAPASATSRGGMRGSMPARYLRDTATGGVTVSPP
eukprot:455515-Prymnesium_polylepis.1